MDDQRPSQTAEGAAIMRAFHQTLDDDPKIIDDPVVLRLVDTQSDFYRSRLEILRQLPLQAGLRLKATFVMRSRFAEDCLEDSCRSGTRQYVILGAGLDTFAYRQPPWARSLRIFEIDHPATQQWKRDRLAAAGIAIPANVSLTPLDFERVSLRDGLSAAGLDFAAPAFFSLLGVSQYLTEDAFDTTLKFVLSMPPRSEIVFSFVASDAALPPDDIALVSASMAQFAAIGEPWISRFAPEDLVARLSALGFANVFHLTVESANQRYFRSRRDGLNAAFIEQMMAATV